MKRLMFALAGFTLATSAPADEFRWKSYWDSRVDQFYSFTDQTQWDAYDASGQKLSEHAPYPAADDFIFYGAQADDYFHWDLGGTSFTVKGLSKGMSSLWQHHDFRFRNGAMTFTENVSNECGYFYVHDGATLTFAATCEGQFGAGAMKPKITVLSGGTLNMLGSFSIHSGGMTIEEGGTVTLDPISFGAESGFESAIGGAYLTNNGTLNLPNGLEFGGTGKSYDGYLTLTQNGGTLNLGGDIFLNAAAARLKFVMVGGTINATTNVSFRSAKDWLIQEVVMPDNATVAINISEGQTVEFASADRKSTADSTQGVVFGENTTIVKGGKGALTFGAKKPTRLQIAAGGTYVLKDMAELGSFVTFNDGATAVIPETGAVVGADLPPFRLRVGTLDLQGELPIRINPEGVSDSFEVTDAVLVGDKGLLAPVPTAGYQPTVGDTFVVGKVPMDAPALSASHKWNVVESDPVEGVKTISLVYGRVGTVIMLR